MNHEDVIRRVLEAEASTVEVRPDALGEIRGRIGGRARRTRRWFPVVAAATATVAAVAVGVATCAPPRQQTPTLPPAATPSTPGATATSAPGTALLAVYYLGANGRLFREFHPLTPGAGTVADRVRAAVTEMLGDTAYDPDYRTAWPAGTTVQDVRVDGDMVTVDLSADAPDQRALHQLVWTVTAVGEGLSARLGEGGEPMRRGPALDELAPVWLVDPQEGAVSGPEIEVYVYAVAFEATVQIRVKQGERTVYEGFVTLDKGPPQRGEARLTLPAMAPGEYTVEAYTISAEDGSEQDLDAHTVTVR
jgi:hypothetical protein